VLDGGNACFGNWVARGLSKLARASRLDLAGVQRTIRPYAGPDRVCSREEYGRLLHVVQRAGDYQSG
jgi:hypothetical protein